MNIVSKLRCFHASYSCVVVSLLFFLSCNKASNPDAEFYNPDELKTYEFKVPSDTLIPTFTNLHGLRLWGVDSLLIMTNGDGVESKLFAVYDINSDSLIARFGTVGNASNEFRDLCYFMYFIKEDGRTYMCCYNDPEISIFDLKKSIEEGVLVVGKHSYDVPSRTCSFMIDKNKFLECTQYMMTDAREMMYTPPTFIIKDKHGTNNEIKLYPKPIISDKIIVPHMYVRNQFFSQEKNKVVDIPTCYDEINIIDLKTRKVLGVKEKNGYGYKDIQEKANDKDALEKMAMVYNYRINCSSKYIFIVQCRCSREAFDDIVNANGVTLSVFDWEGNFLTSLAIRQVLSSIYYNENTKELYGTVYGGEEDGIIAKYDLSKYLK